MLFQTEYARLMKINVSTPLVFTITLYDGFIKTIHQTYQLRKSNLLRKRCLAQTSSNRWMKSRDTERIELDFEKDGIYGTLFIPAGKGPFPGKIFHFVLTVQTNLSFFHKLQLIKTVLIFCFPMLAM